MDFKKYIPEIEKIICYKFKDKSLLTQAFTRTSFCNERRGRTENYSSNEVLEFFGDSVLSTAIVSILLKKKCKRYEYGVLTSLDEGDFSNLRSKLSDKRNLSKTTATLGLQKYLIMGEGDEKLGIENEPSVMEDLFESIIGAIYIDCDMNIDTVISVVDKLIDTDKLTVASAPTMQSHKNALQEWCADKKRRLPAPIYKTVSESGPDHRKTYERGCYIGDKLYGVGIGKNQKLADAQAAELTLQMLQEEDRKAKPSALEALARLKSLAASMKLPSAQFRDLGETVKSTATSKEYSIECSFAGKVACGVGPSKQDARAVAAEAIVNEILHEQSNSKVTPPKRKSTSKTAKITVKTQNTATKAEKSSPKKIAKSTKERPAPKPKRTPAHHKKFS